MAYRYINAKKRFRRSVFAFNAFDVAIYFLYRSHK